MTAHLTTSDLLDEVEWLMNGGMHPFLIAEALGTTIYAVEMKARRSGRTEVRQAFTKVMNSERHRMEAKR